jgi:multiple sugar transport system ATP-binding protein
MNFLPARIEGGRAVLPIADIVLSEETAKQVAGRDLLVAGIRPEHFEDVELVPPDKRARGVEFTADIELTEWLGSEHLAYVPFEAPSTIMDDLRALARELDSESLRSQLVVSIDPASRIGKDARASLWLDPARLHLFDPRTGETLTAVS